jgi:photosystem II stability/assembly factor-like uncharacterized protein
MRTLSTILFTCMLTLFFVRTVHTQWVQTNGPYSEDVYYLAASGANLIAATSSRMLRSTNSGTSWDTTGVPSPNQILGTGTELFAATPEGVFLSTDSGTSWTPVNSGLTILDVRALATIGPNFFAGCFGGVFVSTNNGASWAAADSGLTNSWELTVLSLVARGTTLFVGTAGGVFRSTNNGANWDAANSGLGDWRWVSLIAASGTNLFAQKLGWTGFSDGVFLSTNNGADWVPAITPFSDFSQMLEVGTDLFAGTSSGLFRSANNGTNWERADSGLIGKFRSICVYNGNLLVATDCGLFTSSNKGTSWTFVNPGASANIHINALGARGVELFANASWGYVKFLPKILGRTERDTRFQLYDPLGSCIFRSTDNGDSWVPQMTCYAWCFVIRDSDMFAGTDEGVFRSTDNGMNWTAASAGSLYAAAFAVSESNLFAGNYGGGVFRSTNNGTSWTSVNEGLPKDIHDSTQYAPVISLALSGQNLFAGTECRGAFLSSDGGTSWTAVNEGLPKDIHDSTQYAPVISLALSGQNLFAGTTVGVFLSTNSGTTWIAVNAGLPKDTYDTTQYVEINALALSGQYLFAGTADGVFLSTNNGLTWNAINNGLPQNVGIVGNVGAFAFNDSYVLVGTGNFTGPGGSGEGSFGAGVWKRPLSELVSAVQVISHDMPQSFGLSQNYPNPFNPSTTISYQLPTQSHVTLKIFDVLGREVATLVNGFEEAGYKSLMFDGTKLSSGLYFYRLTAGRYVETKKLLLLR